MSLRTRCQIFSFSEKMISSSDNHESKFADASAILLFYPRPRCPDLPTTYAPRHIAYSGNPGFGLDRKDYLGYLILLGGALIWWVSALTMCQKQQLTKHGS
ncbi:uncharacterized protein PgNI_02769 [Pyricularia grisea]|uniref:Uncharacterized protein n=1 Tax=Pyricularia grisea TaxID=148305 RepID=A0A6P8B9I6_PYRGI|nr:uncharacterized protein PgNI_02769 [Pyricularia grisea]TLD12485.1 hypothetical protein PgNI_02769 [Pyricularia grisea]